jgi:hypothetical protein
MTYTRGSFTPTCAAWLWKVAAVLVGTAVWVLIWRLVSHG